MRKLDTKKLERKPVSKTKVVGAIEEDVDSTEDELTDEQLLQMAEGSCTWGANCHGLSGS